MCLKNCSYCIFSGEKKAYFYWIPPSAFIALVSNRSIICVVVTPFNSDQFACWALPLIGKKSDFSVAVCIRMNLCPIDLLLLQLPAKNPSDPKLQHTKSKKGQKLRVFSYHPRVSVILCDSNKPELFLCVLAVS